MLLMMMIMMMMVNIGFESQIACQLIQGVYKAMPLCMATHRCIGDVQSCAGYLQFGFRNLRMIATMLQKQIGMNSFLLKALHSCLALQCCGCHLQFES